MHFLVQTSDMHPFYNKGFSLSPIRDKFMLAGYVVNWENIWPYQYFQVEYVQSKIRTECVSFEIYVNVDSFFQTSSEMNLFA